MIDRMTESDVLQVEEIERSVFSEPWSARSFLTALGDSEKLYLVERQNGRILGYCGFWISFDVADLCNMAVDEGHRCMGIGKSLLLEGLSCLQERKVERVLLEVRRSNVAAQKMYQKCGFVVIGERKGYYSNPKEDALLMEWN